MNKTIIASFIMIDSKRSKKKSIQRNQAEQEVETQDLNAKKRSAILTEIKRVADVHTSGIPLGETNTVVKQVSVVCSQHFGSYRPQKRASSH